MSALRILGVVLKSLIKFPILLGLGILLVIVSMIGGIYNICHALIWVYLVLAFLGSIMLHDLSGTMGAIVFTAVVFATVAVLFEFIKAGLHALMDLVVAF